MAPAERSPTARERATDQNGLVKAWEAIRRQWKVLLGVFFVLAVLGGYYVYQTPVKYSAGAVIAFEPRAGENNGRDLVALLAQRYPEIVASTDSVAAAAQAAGVSTGELQSGLTAAIQPNTLNMAVSVKLATPEEAEKAVTSLYNGALQANTADPNLKAIPISVPNASASPTGLSKKILYGAVILLSALVALMAALVVDSIASSRRK